MTPDKVKVVEYGNPELASLLDGGQKKANESVKLSKQDAQSKVIIYCHEPYAQSLYDVMAKTGEGTTPKKDHTAGESIKVRAKSYSIKDKIVYCESVDAGSFVTVPFSEFIYDVNQLTPDFKFDVVVLKSDGGAYSATCKNPFKYKEEMELAAKENTWFTVKIASLIRGGYRALYKGTVECFIPGSHAAANIVTDFQSMIGKELSVMIDNYDWSSRMYVVSYKKYVQHSIYEKIHDIKFGHKYIGRLTSNPTDYGLFIEFENYYTGLAHMVDFGNYEEIRKKYKAGDEVEVYVKNITEKKGNYRIVLTFNEADVNKDKLVWYKFKTTCEGKTLAYGHEPENKHITVNVDDNEVINVTLPRDFDMTSLAGCDKIKIHKVNVIRQEIQFDFCK
jgi:ribosomal protein S1